MTRRDYKRIARALYETRKAGWMTNKESAYFDALHTVISAISDELQQENPRFDPIRFLSAACKGEGL